MSEPTANVPANFNTYLNNHVYISLTPSTPDISAHRLSQLHSSPRWRRPALCVTQWHTMTLPSQPLNAACHLLMFMNEVSSILCYHIWKSDRRAAYPESWLPLQNFRGKLSRSTGGDRAGHYSRMEELVPELSSAWVMLRVWRKVYMQET